jgi:hypothetical protein
MDTTQIVIASIGGFLILLVSLVFFRRNVTDPEFVFARILLAILSGLLCLFFARAFYVNLIRGDLIEAALTSVPAIVAGYGLCGLVVRIRSARKDAREEYPRFKFSSKLEAISLIVGSSILLVILAGLLAWRSVSG